MAAQSLRLKPFGRNDYDTLASWIADERAQIIWSATTFPFPLTQNDIEDYCCLCRDNTPHHEFMKAVDPNSGAMVGIFSMKRVDSLGRTGHLSMIMIAPAHRGKGMGSAMVKAALARGFKTKGFRRIQLYVFTFNRAAKTCYSRCGMIAEGYQKKPLIYGEERWVIEVMAASAPLKGR